MCSACIPTGSCYNFCSAFFQVWQRLSSGDAGPSSAPGDVEPWNPAPTPAAIRLFSPPQGLLGLRTLMLPQQELILFLQDTNSVGTWEFCPKFRKEQRPFPCGLVPGRRQWAYFPPVTLHGCPQQFGTVMCLQAAANIWGDKQLQRVADNYQKEEPALCK